MRCYTPRKTGQYAVPPAIFKFADFELDCKRYELRRVGQAVKLEKIPMQLLQLLAESNGRLVSLEEIEEHLWGKGVFVDAEHRINTAIDKIRQVLGDDPDAPVFLQTVERKGYRFIAQTTQIEGVKGPRNGFGNEVKPQVGTHQFIRFATFEVDLQAQELRKGGLRLKLSGQPFQVLAILLEKPGAVVTREELQKRLWPDTFGDVDHNLNTAVNKIREALGDSSENPRFVETLPRRGYRFIGELNVRTPPEETAAVWPQRRLIWSAVVASIAVIAILAFLIFVNVRGWRDRLFAPSSQIQALAVLPFENPSSAPEQEYFCDGMTEALITELGRLGGPR